MSSSPLPVPPDRHHPQTGAGPSAAEPPIELIVLFGGQSAEHDVSCTTAAHVMRAIDPQRYRITPVGIDRDGRWALAAVDQAELRAAEVPRALDPGGSRVTPAELIDGASPSAAAPDGEALTVVLPLLHGPLGEDGTVQGMLELAGVPYVGSGVLGSAVGMDKAMAKQVLAAAGIPQAAFRAVHELDVTGDLAERLVDELGLPLFVKPSNMGSSVGVSKAKTLDQVSEAIENALRYDEWFLAEEAIVGREIEVGVLGNHEPRASVPGEIVPAAEFYDYNDKYLDGASQTLVPAPLGEAEVDEVRRLAVEVFRALRCEGLARIDFFYEEGGRGFLCNEANTMPGFTPISMYPKVWMASGLTYPTLIDELVRLALERHRRRRRNTSH